MTERAAISSDRRRDDQTGIATTTLITASIRRCQGSAAGTALGAPERPEGDVAPEGEGVDDRLPHRGDPGARRPAGALHDLIATGDQPTHRLDREQVAGAPLEAGPAGPPSQAEKPPRLVIDEASGGFEPVELAQCLGRLTGTGHDAEAAALAAADRPDQARPLVDPAEQGLPAGGAGRILGAGARLERDHGVCSALL